MTMTGLEALQRDPYPLYARARRACELTFVPELNAWLVSRYDDVREVLRRPEDFSSANALLGDYVPAPAALAELAEGPGGGLTVTRADGAAHRRLRAPLTTGLSAARVAAAVPFMTERASALVDALAPDSTPARPGTSGGRAELMGQYARRLPGEVIGHMIGLDPADIPAAIESSYHAEELVFRPLSEAEQIGAAREVLAMHQLLDGYIRRCRESPREDLCTGMTRALMADSEPPNPDQQREVVSNLANLLIAGHLTTTALIGTAVLHLLRHRPQWELLCARPDLIPDAVEEAVRYDTPVQGFYRTTTRPLVLAGSELPAGASVFVAYGSANRDESVFERPDEFDITRTRPRHLSFGYGVHACPGAQLAREEVRITLETLTQRIPGLRLAPGQPVTMLPTLIHRSPQTLPVEW